MLNSNCKMSDKTLNNLVLEDPGIINRPNSRMKKKSSTLDIKDRYWVYLFQNLKLAVGEIYRTCESDESINECEKVIKILENFMNDFKLLHQRLKFARDLVLSSRNSPWSISNSSDKRGEKDMLSESFFGLFEKSLGKQEMMSVFTNFDKDMYAYNDANSDLNQSVYTSSAPSPDYYNRLSDVSSAISIFDGKFDDLQSDNHSRRLLYNDFGENLQRDWDSELNNSRSTEYYKADNSDVEMEEDNCEYSYEKEFYSSGEKHDLDKDVNSETLKGEVFSNADDTIDEAILKVYEHEENLALALEKEQDEELRSVIAQEVKLTKQLSVEQGKRYNTSSNYRNVISKDDKNASSNNYFFKDAYLNQLQKQLDGHKRKVLMKNELENDLGSIRAPNRALQIHEKLLLTSRKTSPSEHKRKHEEKQARAQEKRERFYEDRAQKLRELTAKINEVRKIKMELLKAKKLTMKAKLQRAEEKRVYLLQMKAKKAADEEQKAHEILFINNLKEQHRRHDILERYEKKHELIRQNLEEERIRKQEELKTKELAAEVRRKEIETQRLAKLKEMQEKRRIKQSKIEKTLMEKEKDRLESARAKEKTREQRLAALEAQFKAKKEEEKKRILQKQEEWSKRHESNLEEIRKKASEMSNLHFAVDDHNMEVSSNISYEKEKFCKVCNIILTSDAHLQSHLKCVKHLQIISETNQGKHLTKVEIDEFNFKCIVGLAEEMQSRQSSTSDDKKHAVKKRLKKLKNRILSQGSDYENSLKKLNKNTNSNENQNNNIKMKLIKLIKELNKVIESTDKNSNNFNDASNMDRTCREISRILDRDCVNQRVFFELNGLTASTNLLNAIGKSNELKISTKGVLCLIDVITNACKDNYEICYNMLFTNKLVAVIEILHLNLNIVLPSNFNEGNNKLFNESFVSNLIQVIYTLFDCLSESETDAKKSNTNRNNLDFIARINDIISLIVSLGVLNKIGVYLSNIRDFNEDSRTFMTVTNCLNLFTLITKFVCLKKTGGMDEYKNEDTTQLINAYKSTSLVGIISMLYGLLHKDSIPYYKNDLVIKQLPSNLIQILILSFKMLNQIAILSVGIIQNLLGEESLSLQLRHISSYLLWYCTQTNTVELLNEIILLIGYFTVLNSDNQIKIELGTPPTVLQLLCTLPFNYFSDSKLSNILFPTLICCCYKNEKNKNVLSSEISTILLSNFIDEKQSYLNSEDASKKIDKPDQRFEFSKRFPIKLWSDASQYFSEQAL